MDMNTFTLASTAFENNGMIPAKYTCDGEEISPPLEINGAPEGTRSLALIVDDPDIPDVFKKSRGIKAFDHWVLYNIPPETREIPEGVSVGVAGVNSADERKYASPCPPSQYEPREHRYVFSLYALKEILSFTKPPAAEQVRKALADKILAETKLTGRYARSIK